MRGALAIALLIGLAAMLWLFTGEAALPRGTGPDPATADAGGAAATGAAQPAASPETPQRQVATADEAPNLRVLLAGSSAPVPGATVRHRPPEFDWQQLQPDEVQEYRRLEGADTEQFLARVGAELQSDVDGQCRVPVGKDGTPVTARKGELYGEAFVGPDARQPVQLRLRTDRILRILVLDAGGRPVPGIVVHAEREPDATKILGWRTLESAADGRCERAHIQTCAGDADTCFVDLVVAAPGTQRPIVRVDLAAPPPEVVLRLPASGSILVHVRDAAGAPIDPLFLGGKVDLAVFDQQPQNGSELDAALRRERWSAAMAPAGDALFPCVALDRWFVVRVGHWLRRSFPGPTLAAPRCEVTLQEDPRDVVFTALLRRPDGSLFADQPFQFSCRDDKNSTSTSARTDGRGRTRCNLGNYSTGRQAIVGFSCTNREEPLALELPPRLVQQGVNDLGELVLAAPPVILAGRLVPDEGAVVQPVQLGVERRHGSGWSREEVLTSWLADGRFEIRGGVPAGEPLRLSVGWIRPVDQIECTAGDTGIEIPVRTGTVTAHFLVDDDTPTACITSRLERVPPLERINRMPGAHVRFDGAAWLGGSWRGLAAGSYRLTVGCQGVTEPIVQLDAIQVGAGECTDPRLQAIDLRGRVRTVAIRVERPDGTTIVDRDAFVIVRSEGNWWGYSLQTGAVRVVTPDTVDVCVVAKGFQTTTVDGVSQSRTIQLQPASATRMQVALPAPLPDGVELSLQLQPKLDYARSPTITLDTSSAMNLHSFLQVEVAVAADGSATVPVRWNGEHQLSARLTGLARSTGTHVANCEPHTLQLPGSGIVTVRIGLRELADALQRLGR